MDKNKKSPSPKANNLTAHHEEKQYAGLPTRERLHLQMKAQLRDKLRYKQGAKTSK